MAAKTSVGRPFGYFSVRVLAGPPTAPPAQEHRHHDLPRVPLWAGMSTNPAPLHPALLERRLDQVLGAAPIAGQQPRGLLQPASVGVDEGGKARRVSHPSAPPRSLLYNKHLGPAKGCLPRTAGDTWIVTNDVSALVTVLVVVCLLAWLMRWIFKPSRPRGTRPLVDASDSSELGLLDVVAAGLPRAAAHGRAGASSATPAFARRCRASAMAGSMFSSFRPTSQRARDLLG